MRSSHGSAADVVGSSGRSDPGGDNILTRGEDVNHRAVVGERGTSIGNGRCTDSRNLSDTSGGGRDSVNVGVAGGDGDVNSIVVCLVVYEMISFARTWRKSSTYRDDTVIEGSVGTTSQRHRDDRRSSASVLLLDDIVNAGNDA